MEGMGGGKGVEIWIGILKKNLINLKKLKYNVAKMFFTMRMINGNNIY